MLFFELFPAVFAVVSGIVVLILFAVNHRAKRDPQGEAPRAPSRPDVTPEAAAAEATATVRRPSMAP